MGRSRSRGDDLEQVDGIRQNLVATGEVVDYRRRARTLREVAAWGEGQVNLTGSGDPERVAAASVTANTFSVLGVGPAIGRVFSSTEDLPKGPNVVVLGYALWSRRYSADPSIVGRSIQIDGRPYEVVGIMPAGFLLPTDYQNPQPSQLWVPQQLDPTSMDHGSHGLFAAGRLQEGATVAQAAEELHDIARAMTREGLYPAAMRFDTVTLSLEEEVVGGVRRSIWLLFGAVGFLLLIACANVANLLLARAEARQREIAVRAALGAGGRRMVRQLLTESLLLTSLSAIVGLALAGAGVRLLAWWNPASIPRIAGVTVDLRVAVFTIAMALVTSVLFGLAGAAGASGWSRRVPQGRQPERLQRKRPAAFQEHAGRPGDGARRRSSRWRRPDAPQPVGPPERSHSGCGHQTCYDDEDRAASGKLSEPGAGRRLLSAADGTGEAAARRRESRARRAHCPSARRLATMA